MVSRILASIVVFSALTGCGVAPPRPPPTPTLAEADWLECLPSAPVVKGTPLSPAARAKCVIKINVTGDCPDPQIDYSNLDLALKLGSKPARIVWELPEGYRFCPVQSDGAFLKFFDTTNQMSEPAATDDPDGGNPSTLAQCYRRFRMNNENKESTKGVKYGYWLKFTDRNNNTCMTRDPQIRNG